jgi:hypothetical protein
MSEAKDITVFTLPKVKSPSGDEYQIDMVCDPVEIESKLLNGDKVQVRLTRQVRIVTTKFANNKSQMPNPK